MLSIRCNSRVKSRMKKKILKEKQKLNLSKKYQQKETNFPLEKYDWKKFEKNNAYASKHNSNSEKQV